jgi:hypothetical protein
MSVEHEAVRVERASRGRAAMREWITADPQGVREYIEERVQMVPWSGCWLWDRAMSGCGYGNACKRIGDRKRWFRAHALAYEAFVGQVPDGMILRHRCDVKACCNPDHLETGTHSENSRDMVERGRAATGDKNGSRTRPERLVRGERHGMAKLTEGDVKLIFELRARSMLQREIAAEFGVSQVLVSRILSGNLWAHIKDVGR